MITDSPFSFLVRRHVSALMLSLKREDPPLSLKISLALTAAHLLGVLMLARISHQSLLLALAFLLPAPALFSWISSRKFVYRIEGWAPLGLAYLILAVRVGLALLARWLGVTQGALTVPEPVGLWLDLPSIALFAVTWSLMSHSSLWLTWRGIPVDAGLGNRYLVVGMLWVGALVRVIRLDSQWLWYDELISVETGLAAGCGACIENALKIYAYPPLHYYVLNWIFVILPDGAFAARLVSVFAGVLVLAFTYRIAAHLTGPAGSFLALMLMTVSPVAAHFSQEARAFALATAFATGSTWCLLRAIATSKASWWLSYLVLAAAILYTHYVGAFVLLGQGFIFLIALISRRRGVLIGVASFVGLGVLILPPLYWLSRSTDQTIHSPVRPGLGVVELLQFGFAGDPRYFDQTQATLALVFSVVAVVLAGWATSQSRRVLWIGLMIVLPFVLFVGVALPALGRPLAFYEGRLIVVSQPFLVLMTSAGIIGLWKRGHSLCLVGALTVLLALLWFQTAGLLRYHTIFVRAPEEFVGRYLMTQARSGDLILSRPEMAGLTLDYYLKPRWTIAGRPSHSNSGWIFTPDLGVPVHSAPKWSLPMAQIVAFPRVWYVDLHNDLCNELVADLTKSLGLVECKVISSFEVCLFGQSQ